MGHNQPTRKTAHTSSARLGLGLALLVMLGMFACPGPPALPEGGQEMGKEGQAHKEASTKENAAEASREVTQDASEPSNNEPTPSPDEPSVVEHAPENPVIPEEKMSPDTSEPSVERAPEVTPEPLPEPTQEKIVESAPDTSTPDNVVSDQPSGSTIGKPCTKDSDCGSQPNRCIPEGAQPSFPFPNTTGNGPPGGYCTQACFVGSNSCPKGSDCYVPGAASGVCLKQCTSDKDCRPKEGYACQFEAGSNTKFCMPPPCARKQPVGNYNAILGPSSTKGTCTNKPLPSGTKIGLTTSLTSGVMEFQFWSKPGSPLPVTWGLRGAYKGLRQPFTATNPQSCTQSCDGLLKGAFSNSCLYFGTLEIKSGTNCWHVYDVSMTPR